MRIALVCPYHMFRGGGVQECVSALQKDYTARGHYARIITPLPKDYDGPIPESIITLGTSRNTTAFAGTAWQWSFSVDSDSVDEVFEREKFDVVHFHEPWIPIWCRQLLLRTKKRTACVGTMHGRFWDTMTAKTVTTAITPYTKPMLKHFDVFTAVSEPATEYFRSLSHRPVLIVPNGIYIDKYAPKDKPKSPAKGKTILYIGRLEHRKGLKYLLRAFADLAKKRKDIELVIAGTGVDEKKLKDFVRDNEIPRVTFVGYVSDEEKIRLLHEADLFCSPATYGESFGIVLLEAMAAGTPIVAGDNVGYQSVMTGTGAMSLVNPKDTIDFTRRLELMTYDDNVRKVWGDWAVAHLKQFDYHEVAQQYIDVYKQAIERHEQRKT